MVSPASPVCIRQARKVNTRYRFKFRHQIPIPLMPRRGRCFQNIFGFAGIKKKFKLFDLKIMLMPDKGRSFLCLKHD